MDWLRLYVIQQSINDFVEIFLLLTMGNIFQVWIKANIRAESRVTTAYNDI